MDEPPAKRPKRTDSAAMWDKDEKVDSRPSSSGRDPKPRPHYGDDRTADRSSRRDDDHRRKRSRSREYYERRRDRSRSGERSRRERDRGARDRDVNGTGRRERSRSRDRHRPARDYRNDRPSRRSRSRSPVTNGGSTSVRTRSPPRRTEHDRPRSRERKGAGELKAGPVEKETASTNGDHMAVDELDEEELLKKMMGFTTFKTTQNKKVPGNQIYGVRKEKKTEYRQYMNRVGGFNRPLSPTR
ncbi:hypothetical protein ABEF95_013310 [Exophiala dermatitidis]